MPSAQHQAVAGVAHQAWRVHQRQQHREHLGEFLRHPDDLPVAHAAVDHAPRDLGGDRRECYDEADCRRKDRPAHRLAVEAAGDPQARQVGDEGDQAAGEDERWTLREELDVVVSGEECSGDQCKWQKNSQDRSHARDGRKAKPATLICNPVSND